MPAFKRNENLSVVYALEDLVSENYLRVTKYLINNFSIETKLDREIEKFD
jgi:hypothetical protein